MRDIRGSPRLHYCPSRTILRHLHIHTTMILNENAHTTANGVANGVKKPANGESEESGSRYWGKRYIPNQGESFEVSIIILTTICHLAAVRELFADKRRRRPKHDTRN